jgi:hypothetical protein
VVLFGAMKSRSVVSSLSGRGVAESPWVRGDEVIHGCRAVLDTLLRMRDEYSVQFLSHGGVHPTPAPGTAEKVRRQDLRRTLHAQVSVFKDQLRSRRDIHILATVDPEPWGMGILDRAIESATDLLSAEASRLFRR